MSDPSSGGLMVSSMRTPSNGVEPTKRPPVERPVMSDDRRTFDLSTVRKRAGERADSVDENVLAAMEDRADDGRITADAFADWHRACRDHYQSAAADVADAEARFEALLDSIQPADRETNQVRSRVEEYESQLDAMRSALSTTDDRLDATPERPDSPAAAYEVAAQLHRAGRVVHEVAHSHHHVEEGLDAFETWLDDPATRIDDFGDEIGGFERYLDNTEGLLDRLESDDSDEFEPFDAWLSAYHLQRMMALVFDELRADMAELETCLERQDGTYDDELATLRERLDALETRHGTCSERLDAAAEDIEEFESKREAVADSLDRFEATLDEHEPPVDWEAVEELVQSQFDELGIQGR
jgi:chromosome segregation ATPase